MTKRFSLAAKDTFRSLHVRNFRLFFSGQLISQVGNWLTLVAQTLLVLHLGGSGVAIGLLTACQFAPVLLLGPWAGLVADRADKRKLLLAVQSFAMVQSFMLAAIAFMHHPPLAYLYPVAFLGGISMAFDNPARRAFVVEMVDAEDMPNAVSLNSALMTSSRVVGPALAGLLATTVGFGWCFTTDALSYIAVLIGLYMMRTEELRPSPVATKEKGQVRAGIAYIRSQPDLRIPLVMMGVVGTLSFNFSVVVPLFVTKTLHGNGATFTLLFSVLSLGSLFGALYTARRRTIAVRNVVVASLVFGTGMLVLSAAPNLGAAFPIAWFVGLGSISFLTASTAIVQIRSDPAMRGRVLAIQAMLFLGSTPIGGPILGLVCDTYGARAGLILGGTAAISAAAWGEWAYRRVPKPADAEATDESAAEAAFQVA